MYDFYKKEIIFAETNGQLDRILSAAARCTTINDYEYGLLCVAALEKSKEVTHGKY